VTAPVRARWLEAVLRTPIPDATSVTVAVAAALVGRMSPEGVCWPSEPTITREARCAERSVRDHVAVLERAGLLDVERREGAANTYRATFPDAEPRQELPGYPGNRPREPRQMTPQTPAGAAAEAIEAVKEAGSAAAAVTATAASSSPSSNGRVPTVAEEERRRGRPLTPAEKDELLARGMHAAADERHERNRAELRAMLDEPTPDADTAARVVAAARAALPPHVRNRPRREDQ
jgi:hypothetical protein